MAQAAIPQKTEKEEAFSDLEGPVMDAFWSVECAREMVEEEMNSIFGQTKDGNLDVKKVYFSRIQAERLVWMMGQASDKLEALKAAYYREGN